MQHGWTFAGGALVGAAAGAALVVARTGIAQDREALKFAQASIVEDLDHTALSMQQEVKHLRERIAELRATLDSGTVPQDMVEARRGSNETAAIGALRVINTAQSIFREGDKDANGVFDYASSLEMLGKYQLIDNVLASGRKQGYAFRIVPGGDFRNQYKAVATPLEPGKSGKRAFFVDESGVIRFTADGSEPNEKSSPIGG
jgi:hypothetical protein